MKRIFLLLALLCSWTFVIAQNVSNEGRNFFCTFPVHDPTSNQDLANITIFVTSKQATVATVSCGTFTLTKNIPANTAVGFNVPRNEAYMAEASSNVVIRNRAIRITVPDGQPKVAAYAHVYAGRRSAATLILPFESLGQNYYSMNYTQTLGTTNFTTIVAAEANTSVIIHLKNGSTRTIKLDNVGDTYQLTNNNREDQTGVYLEVDPSNSACKRFAAFSGTSSSFIGDCQATSVDPLFQQLYATASWGKNFGVVPFVDRRFIIRILAKDDNTVVNFNGNSIQIPKGLFYESPIMTTNLMITSNNPISVAQYSLSQSCSAAVGGGSILGDPEMVLLNPIEFGIKNITMFSSTLQSILEQYINVFIRTDARASFRVNNSEPTGVWRIMDSDPTYSYMQIPVAATSLTLTANAPFNSYAYGFGATESYGYSAGTSLAATQFLTVEDTQTGLTTQEACEQKSYKIKITVPAEAKKLTWKFNDGDPDYVQNNPAGEITTENGKTFYTYTLPVNKTYPAPGIKSILVVAESPSTPNGCSIGETEYSFDIVVNQIPVPDFTSSANNCSGRTVTFQDNTPLSNIFKLAAWQWDFGDGKTSTEQNPTHIYTLPGTYTVSLVAKTEGGCFSAPVTKQVNVSPSPTSKFTGLITTCLNTTATFTDQSTVDPTVSIVKWSWDFGDGTTEVKNTGTPVTHQYANPGTYTIKLITESNLGCISDPFEKQIVVTSLPIPDFTIPEVCLTDAIARFENASSWPGQDMSQLTYSWNFGDPGSGALNTSVQLDGTHKFNSVGEYNVTLTITNSNNCTSVLTKKITVNGASPVAEFEVQNPSDLCSNRSVTVKNMSTVDFGNITRLEWYIDNVNQPTQVIVDEDPTFNKLYVFDYIPFSTPLTKTMTIKLVAYSGGVCSSIKTETITLKASPNLVFTALPNVCINQGKVQFTQASEIGQSIGRLTYSGQGVTADGLFDPTVAGSGTHTITATFLNDNGCSDTKTQQVNVSESPVIEAGSDFVVLAGGQLRMKATATGTNLTYKWTPAAGLDADNVLNPMVTPTSDQEYTLTVTSDKGCISVDKVRVTIVESVTPINSFSPNGDGVNDVWNIQYINSYPKATVEVFNRYGGRVFFSKGYPVPFDGTYKNISLPVGTYYYIITTGIDKKPITGSVTLIR